VMGVALSLKYNTMNNCLGCNMDRFVTQIRVDAQSCST